MLLARIDAEAAQTRLARSGHMRSELDTVAAAYLTSIQDEAHLIGTDEASRNDQVQEAIDARRLIAMAKARPAALADMRILVRHMAARENEEARATMSVAGERDLEPLPRSNLREVQQLVDHFDHMAQAVENKVRSRTAELQDMNRQLADTDRRRRLFLSKVSHELRTPVTVMRGEAEVALRCDHDVPALRDALHQIVDSDKFLERRLEDLLALARAEDGALPLRRNPVDLAEIARQVGRSAAGFAAVSGVRLELAALDGAMPVAGDPDRLRQAMLALVDNGIKFSPPDGVFSLRGRRGSGGVGIIVADEGPGVVDGELQRIFDPYVQGKAGRSLGGTGLGVSLARWVVQGHDGAISAHNGMEGEGLCVSLSLPERG
ncbi:sensor histidine kinase [Sphingobium sp.]|uniref:sensor histidine kinase n=1 Tax=Sphingobium sp. TaxID=1912891 RepID=UPI003B3B50E2